MAAPRLSKQEAINAIAKAGTVTGACKLLGITRDKWYRHAKHWNGDLDDAIIEKRMELADMAENVLRQHLIDGNLTAAIYCSKTLGRNRGFTERQEIAGVKDQPLNVEFIPADE